MKTKDEILIPFGLALVLRYGFSYDEAKAEMKKARNDSRLKIKDGTLQAYVNNIIGEQRKAKK